MSEQYYDKVEDGQLYWHYSKLRNWEKNKIARTISEDKRLQFKADIQRRGIREDFKIDTDGVVYDGNHRLELVTELINEGFKEANGKSLEWIPVKVVTPRSEAEKWEIALQRNEQFAQWNMEGLNQFKSEFENEIDVALFNIEVDEPVGLDQELEELVQDLSSEGNEPDDSTDENENADQKPKELHYRITISCTDSAEQDWIMSKLAELGINAKATTS